MINGSDSVNDTLYFDAMLEVAGSGEKLARKYLQCLDPVHVGEGGYRMGHIDNTIMRDKPTGLPFVPGTSLKGAVRQGAFLWLAENLLRHGAAERKSIIKKADEFCRQVFGQINDDGDEQVNGESRHDARAGLARFYDLLPVFFPVPSCYGPVWLVCPELAGKWLELHNDEELQLEEGSVYPLRWEGAPLKETVRLGWLNLRVIKTNEFAPVKPPPISIGRILLVAAGTFGRLVKDNMEIRTSVKIGRESGAAETGALFTYEALPRFTVLGLEVLWPEGAIYGCIGPAYPDLKDGVSLLNLWLQRLQTIGLGGYGNKGFGRVKLLAAKGVRA